jgi:hypothetical protein
MEATLNARAAPLTTMQWLILVTAGIGFAFDMYEIVVQAIIVRPLLMELGPFQPGTPIFNRWTAIMLFLPTTIGGLTALWGGLPDRPLRPPARAGLEHRAVRNRRVLLGLRHLVAGAHLLALHHRGRRLRRIRRGHRLVDGAVPEAKRREAMLGFAQVCATGGNFMIAGAYYAAVTWGDLLPAIHGGHSPWRYALLYGALPAIPLILIRPFLPESPAWREKRDAGTLKRPSFRALFTPRFRRVTLLTTGLVACCYALAFGMLQHIPRIVPGLPQVAELPRKQQEQWVTWVHLHVDIGALTGRLIVTGLLVWFVARRPMLRWILWAGLALFPLVFLGPVLQDASTFKYAALLVTLVVGMQYNYWGNYLPRVFHCTCAAPARASRSTSARAWWRRSPR